MIFMLSLLALAGSAGCVGLIIGMAHGIEVEKKRRPLSEVPRDNAA